MKYLKKIFEKENEKYWIVIYTDLKNDEISHEELYDEEESAENHFLELVNDEKERMFEFKGKEFTLNDVFTNPIEAKKWMEESVFDVRISYSAIFIEGKCEESERVKLAKQVRKLNI